MDSPTLSLPQASAISALSLLNSLVILISSLERTFVAKRQHDDSAFASVRSSTWQHPRAFYYLWIFRGTLGVVFCLLPLAPMWIEFVHQERTGNTEFAVIWAASTLVACIAGSIAGERLLYLGVTDSLTPSQITCTIASITGIVLLVIGELVPLIPVPIAWSVSGCALHRFSMIAWWYTMTHNTFTSRQFRDRARFTLAGHGVVFASVFLTFLPVLRTGFNRLFWLFSIFFAVELITTAQAVRMTCSSWVAEKERRRRPTPRDSPSLRSSTDLPLHHPPPPRESDEVDLADIRPAKHRDGDVETFYESAGDEDEVPLATMLKMNGGERVRSPARSQGPGR